MAVNYAPLISEWGALQSGDTTAQKLAAINEMMVPGPNQPVAILDAVTWLRAEGLWLGIKAAALAGTSQGAMAAVDLNEDPRAQTIDFSLPAVQGMLTDLVSHNLLTQAQATALAALGTPPIPWWQANGFTAQITLDDLAAAGGLT